MSKPVTVTIPHQLGRLEARRRLDEGVDKMIGQLGSVGTVSKAWDGDVLRFSVTAMGQVVNGFLHVFDQEVRLEVILPGFLAMLANKVKGRIAQEGAVLLEDKRR
jgi:hypothetical protein